MGIVFRQSVKTTLVAILGAILGGIIMWLSIKYIPNREFGYTRYLTTTAVYLSQILLVGLQSTLGYYIHKYADNTNKRNALITVCMLFPLITFVIVFLMYTLFKQQVLHHTHADDIALTVRYYYWLPIYAMLFVYQTLLELYLGSQMKNAVAAFMREVVVRVLGVITILLYGFGFISFPWFVAAMVLIYLVPVIIYLILSYGTEKFGFSFNFKVFNKTEFKDIVNFSWYHFLLTIAFTFIGGLDALMLPFSDQKGYLDSGIYALAYYIISIIQLPNKAMSSPTMTVLAKAFAEDDMARAKDAFTRSSLNILIATVGMALLVCCNLGDAVAVFKTGYEQVIPVCLILLVGRFIDLATGMNDLVLSIAKYYRFNFYLAMVLIPVFYLLLRFFIHHYGIYGAAWSASIIYVCFNLVKFIFVWVKLGMQPFSVNTLLVIIAGIPALAVGYFFPHLFPPHRHMYVHAFIEVSIRSFLIIVVYLFLLIVLKPSVDLQEYLATIKKNKRLF